MASVGKTGDSTASLSCEGLGRGLGARMVGTPQTQPALPQPQCTPPGQQPCSQPQPQAPLRPASARPSCHSPPGHRNPPAEGGRGAQPHLPQPPPSHSLVTPLPAACCPPPAPLATVSHGPRPPCQSQHTQPQPPCSSWSQLPSATAPLALAPPGL